MHTHIDSDINHESWCFAQGVPDPFNPKIVTPVMPPSTNSHVRKTSLELDLIELTNLEGRSKFTTSGSKVLTTPHPSCLPLGQASHSVAPSSDLGLKARNALSMCRTLVSPDVSRYP